MKRIVSVLLALCLALSAAACSRSGGGSLEDKYIAVIRQALDDGDTEKAQGALEEALQKFPDNQTLLALQEAADAAASGTAPVSQADTQQTVTTASTTAETTTAASEAGGDSSLEPSREDLERLSMLFGGGSFFGKNYDCTKDNILDYLYHDGYLFDLLCLQNLGFLQEEKNLFVHDEGGGTDPRGCFPHWYVRVKADVLNACMENVFCNTVYKSHTLAYGKDGAVAYYLRDGWYYFTFNPSGMEEVEFHADGFRRTDNGRLLVTVKKYPFADEDAGRKKPIAAVDVEAALLPVNGKKLWAIYKTTIVK